PPGRRAAGTPDREDPQAERRIQGRRGAPRGASDRQGRCECTPCLRVHPPARLLQMFGTAQAGHERSRGGERFRVTLRGSERQRMPYQKFECTNCGDVAYVQVDHIKVQPPTPKCRKYDCKKKGGYMQKKGGLVKNRPKVGNERTLAVATR